MDNFYVAWQITFLHTPLLKKKMWSLEEIK